MCTASSGHFSPKLHVELEMFLPGIFNNVGRRYLRSQLRTNIIDFSLKCAYGIDGNQSQRLLSNIDRMKYSSSHTALQNVSELSFVLMHISNTLVITPQVDIVCTTPALGVISSMYSLW